MEQLIEHFQDAVWRRARYRLGDYDEAWEVAQETFLLCFRKIHQYRGQAPFWAWLARIAENQIRNRHNWWRRRGANRTFSLDDRGPDPSGADDPRPLDVADPAPSPRRLAAGREELALLEQALGALSDDHREVLLLRFADGLSYDDIARLLGISLGTVKSRINRARAELRRWMEHHA